MATNTRQTWDDTNRTIAEMFNINKNSMTTPEEQTELLNNATYAAYDQTKLENQRAQNQFIQNQASTQASALDAIRRSNASAIASGANAGLQAANQLSAILGLQEQNVEQSTNIANEAIAAAQQLNTDLNNNAVEGANLANTLNAQIGANNAQLAGALATLGGTAIQAAIQEDTNAAAASEQQYNNTLTSLDTFFDNWRDNTVDYTYATEYYNPLTGQIVKPTKNSDAGPTEMKVIVGEIKKRLEAAKASGDQAEITKWTNEALKFINSVKIAQNNHGNIWEGANNDNNSDNPENTGDGQSTAKLPIRYIRGR